MTSSRVHRSITVVSTTPLQPVWAPLKRMFRVFTENQPAVRLQLWTRLVFIPLFRYGGYNPIQMTGMSILTFDWNNIAYISSP